MASENCTNDSVELCDWISADVTYVALTWILLLVSSFALLIHVFFFFLLHRSRSFHSNVRLLLQNFSISGCYVSIHSIGRCVYNFVLLHRGFILISTLRCEWVETVFNASEGSLTLSMAFIGLDRLISTIRHKHVDKERPTRTACGMVVISWAAGIIFHLSSICVSSHEPADKRRACYCQATLVTPVSILYYMVAAFFFTEFSTAICYVILYRYSVRKYANFTINTAKHSLAERHQMMSNVTTSILLCPSIILHGSVYAIISLSFLPLRLYVSEDSYTSHINYALLVLIVIELEMMTQAILLIVRKDTLRKITLDYFPMWGRLIKEANKDKLVRLGNASANKVVPVNTTTAKSGVQTTRNVGGRKGKLIDFRIKPEDNDNILNAMWAAAGPSPKIGVRKA